MNPFARTLQIALGAAFVGVAAAVILDYHGHRCEACGTTWRHLGAFNHGDVPAHSCWSCGTEQWRKSGAFATARGLHNATGSSSHG